MRRTFFRSQIDSQVQRSRLKTKDGEQRMIWFPRAGTTESGRFRRAVRVRVRACRANLNHPVFVCGQFGSSQNPHKMEEPLLMGGNMSPAAVADLADVKEKTSCFFLSFSRVEDMLLPGNCGSSGSGGWQWHRESVASTLDGCDDYGDVTACCVLWDLLGKSGSFF